MLANLGLVRSTWLKNEESETPLFLACARGHYDVAKLLIADGAEVMARDAPLHKAAAEGHLGVIKLLLEKVLKSMQLVTGIRNGHHSIKHLWEDSIR